MHPLFILPFDHRSSFARDLLGATYPVSKDEHAKLSAYKEIVFNGLLYAKSRYSGNGTIATIIDEEFGSPVIPMAQANTVPLALTTEATGTGPFAFIHGADFRVPLQRLRPAYAKALIHYEVGNEERNSLARERLHELSTYCASEHIGFMLEVLISNLGAKSQFAGKMINEMTIAGVAPTVWKIESLETEDEWHELATHTSAPIIILGRGASREQVDAWIATAARSGNVHGFAVGRTVFLDPLRDYVAHTTTREATITAIGENFLHYIRLWEKEAR